MTELTLSSNEFKALSSETRVSIIKMLGDRNYTLTELAKKMQMASPSMKQHLELLVENDLIQQVDEGRKWKYYTLTRKGKDIVAGRESDTTILIVLSVSSIALFAVLFMLAGTLGTIDLQLMQGNAALSTANYEAPVLGTGDLMHDSSGATSKASERAELENIGKNRISESKDAGPIGQAIDIVMVYAMVIIALVLAAIIGFMTAKFYGGNKITTTFK